MFYSVYGKRSKKLHPAEMYYILETKKFIDEYYDLYKKYYYLSTISGNVLSDVSFIKDDDISFHKNDVFSKLRISEDIFKNIVNILNTFEENHYIVDNKREKFDVCVCRYKNFIILTNSYHFKNNLNYYKITSFENLFKKALESKENFNLFFDEFFNKNINKNILMNSVNKIISILERYDDFCDEKFIKLVLDEIFDNHNIFFLIIVKDNGDVSCNLKTVIKKSTIIFNLNFKKGKLIKNNIGNFVFGKFYESSYRYFRNSTLNEDEYYFLFNSFCNIDDSLNYLQMMKNFSIHMSSKDVFKYNGNEYIELPLFRKIKDDLIEIDFYFITENFYRNKFQLPYRVCFIYNLKNKESKIKKIFWNDFDRKNPRIVSNFRGLSLLYVYIDYYESQKSYSKRYSFYKLSKKNNIYQRNFNNIEELPYFKKNKTELLKIFAKSPTDESFIQNFFV